MPIDTTELEELFTEFQLPQNLLGTILVSIVIVLAGVWISRRVASWTERSLNRAEVEPTMSRFLGQALYFFFLTIVLVVVLAYWGIPTGTIIAVLGAATLAVGLALQDSMANLASGVLVVVLKPFVVGDSVELDGKRGVVQEVRLFNTMLRDRDNRDIYVPNSKVMDGIIVNFSSSGCLRLDLEYGIAYEADIDRAMAIFEDILASDPRVLEDPPPVVAVKRLGESSVDFAVRPHVKVEDEVGTAFDITEAVKRRLDEAGVTIPFPQRDVHLIPAPGAGRDAGASEPAQPRGA